jgi:hypothetical protein
MSHKMMFTGVAAAFLLTACSSSSSSSGGPVIDSLDVPSTTSQMTVSGQTGPGVIMTLSAHDDDSGISALHAVFAESGGADQPIQIPNAPTTISNQQIELVILNAPSGSHAVSFHLTDAKGRSSESIAKTITVP